MSSEEETKQTKDQEETEDKKKEKTDEEVFVKPTVPTMPLPAKNKADIEKEQESQLRSKYPGLKGPGSSAFLQKRLAKGQKFFDSGDYNMARAKGGASKAPLLQSQKLLLPPGTTDAPATGDEIPTPDTVPQRKASIVPPIHPNQQSQFTSIPAHLSS